MTETAHITVVDDDQSIREALPKMLRSYGFSADALDSGEAFLVSDLLRTTNCLVLDIAMPGMSGPDLFRELRSRQIQIPIIFITAHGEGLRGRLLDQGAAAFIRKPFDPPEIVEAIETALGAA